MEKKDKEIFELTDLLIKAQFAYEQGNATIMSDFEYDSLYDKLKALEEETGIVLEHSPTKRVGYEVVSNLTKVSHDQPMLSLDKTKEIAKLEAFLSEGDGILSWKLDGLTVVVKYENGKLFQAVTRGNGQIGEDVTHNAKTFSFLPQKITFNGKIVIRGEAVISYSEFDKINLNLSDEEKYKNPRNLCSGTVRQLNSKIAAKRKVAYFAFSLVHAEGMGFLNKSDSIEWLRGLGFCPVEFVKVNKSNIVETVEQFKNSVQNQDYGSDGLVLTYDNIEFSESLGQTSKFPKDSIAYKWADETRETKLQEIIWNTSRTGLINPIAVFEPVELEGTTVERAGLHNLSIIENLKLGIGDTVKVYKANMIIPQILENLTESGAVEAPKRCLECDGETEIRNTNGVKTVHCINPACRAKLVQLITHFSSRDAMNIEGFSEQTIEKFIEKGYLKDISDIYRLDRYSDEIKSQKGFGVKSVDKLIQSIEKSKSVQLQNFIYALGIDNVGLTNAKLLCTHFDGDFECIRNAGIDDYLKIEGYGEIIAKSLYDYFNNPISSQIVNRVLGFVSLKEVVKNAGASTLNGKVFVITGETVIFESRRELQEAIEKSGGKVTGSVTAKTNFLINNDASSMSAKNQKAKELGVSIITEEEFMKILYGTS